MPIKLPQNATYTKEDVDVESGLTQKSRRGGKNYMTFSNAASKAKNSARRKKFAEKLCGMDTKTDFDACYKSKEDIEQIKSKDIRRFYERQNDSLADWNEVDAIVRAMAYEIFDSFEPEDLDGDGVAEVGGALQNLSEHIEPLLPKEQQQARAKERKQAKIAINVNVVANIVLLAAKVTAFFFSNSLSLVASMVDSALDLFCVVIIWGTSKIVSYKSSKLSRRYPVGRRRLEPLGLLVFSIIMVVSFLQILQESASRLLANDSKMPNLPPVAIGGMAGTIGLKGLIWFGCAFQKSEQVQALAQDCKTDVIFNTASLLFPAIGIAAKVWWLDAVGAGILSIYIIYDWAQTCLMNVDRLTGSAAESKMQRKLMYMCWRFSPLVDAYKTMNAYYAGNGIWVEVDIILDESTDLRVCHDVAEALQYSLEGLKEVDRAFVSVDYIASGPFGHAAVPGS